MNRDDFICSHLGLVHTCVRRFTGKGIEYDDLYQAGLSKPLMALTPKESSAFPPMRCR